MDYLRGIEMETENVITTTIHLGEKPDIVIRLNNIGNEEYYAVHFGEAVVFNLAIPVVFAIRDVYGVNIKDCRN